jgi:hypothetical protein
MKKYKEISEAKKAESVNNVWCLQYIGLNMASDKPLGSCTTIVIFPS